MAKPSKLLNSFIFHLHFLLFNFPQFLFYLIDSLFSLYYKFRGVESSTVDLDGQTTLHFWIPAVRRSDKPNLVLIHGYGGDSRWQFLYQIGPLSRNFNLFLPDLLFFGKSYTTRSDRNAAFQGECIAEGLRRLGVERYMVYSISYGGYVAFRMAEICPREMERLVIVSSGVGWDNEEEIVEQIMRVGRDPTEVLLPSRVEDLRLLVRLSTCKGDPLRFLPDFFLREFINAMTNNRRKEKLELLEHLLSKKAEKVDLPVLTQETLLIWGDKDKIFPVHLAHQLQRHLGSKSRVEIIKDTGHAANIESPAALNRLITEFVLGAKS